MRCDACGQEVGKCVPACPYAGVVFIDEYLSRHSRTPVGSSPIDTEDAPAGANEAENFSIATYLVVIIRLPDFSEKEAPPPPESDLQDPNEKGESPHDDNDKDKT